MEATIRRTSGDVFRWHIDGLGETLWRNFSQHQLKESAALEAEHIGKDLQKENTK